MASLAAGTIAGVAGCGAPEARPAGQPLSITSPADSGTASASGTAAASGAPATPASNVTVEPGWVHEHPELTRLFPFTNACSKEESFTSFDGKTIHSYDVRTPWIAQSELEARYRERATELGYSVTDSVNGRGFWDKAKGISSDITDERIDVLFTIPVPPAKAASGLAGASGFSTWPMLAGLSDATWERIRITLYPGTSDLDATLSVGAAGRKAVERWAQEHKLARDKDTWIQKWQPPPASQPGIALDFDEQGKLTVVEGLGQEVPSQACQEHPTRKPTPPQPKKTRSESDKEDDELIKQMMQE